MKFSAFNINSDLVNILSSLGYVNATPIQEVVIPKALRKENLVVKSETGSGKTHAFLIPIINNTIASGVLQAIILAPSRELVRQTYNFARELVEKEPYNKLSVKMFTSGEDSNRDIKSFKNGCDILIATPGKLEALMRESDFDLSTLKCLVLDEADMLLDEGFFPLVDSMLQKCSDNTQIEVFSATISENLEIFLKKYISPDYAVTNDGNELTSKTVNHIFINTKHRDMNNLILSFINQFNPYLLLIFANSKKKTREIYSFLVSNKLKCGILSSELEPRERRSMIRRINNNEFPIVVCSDLVSRGLDIKDVSDVLSVDLPNNIEYYYHRAGRTGRNFNTGNSYVFYDHDSIGLLSQLENQGLSLTYMKYDGENFVPDVAPNKKKVFKKKVETELDIEIRKAKNKVKSKKVKPGYKKKVKIEVEKVKRKHRRKMIQKDIRRQREERYKNETRSKKQ